MRRIEINQNTFKRKRKTINYNNVTEVLTNDDGVCCYQFHCYEPHGLTNDDEVVLRLNRNNKYPFTHIFKVIRINDVIFQINIPRYYYVNVTNYAPEPTKYYIIGEDEYLASLIYYTTSNSPTNYIPALIFAYNEELSFFYKNRNGVYIPLNITSDTEIVTEYRGDNAIIMIEDEYIYNFIKNHETITLRYGTEIIHGYINVNNDNEEDAAAEAIICDRPLGFIGSGYLELYCDWFTNNSDDFFFEEIEIEDRNISFSVSLGLTNNESYRLNNEQEVYNEYLADVKKSIIPEIIDYEKRQFSPVLYDSTSRKYKYASEITFNLHFRSRIDLDSNDGSLRDNWSTTDSQYWNYMTVNDQNTMNEWDDKITFPSGYDETLSDELNLLGFTEDDIKYSKTKIKKSFLRLLFYSDKNMLSKNLLCYSTIFLDAGALYSKYINIKSRGLSCFDSGRTDDTLRLSAQFNVKNKYSNKKCSEGFYAYLFPNELTENAHKTIYMKIEFNHAGYGKTIPMMLPTTSTTEGLRVISPKDNNFPLNFSIKTNNGQINYDFEKYQNYNMIPIEIWYDNVLKDYVYSFPFVDGRGGKIVLNIYEPRVKGYIE